MTGCTTVSASASTTCVMIELLCGNRLVLDRGAVQTLSGGKVSVTY